MNNVDPILYWNDVVNEADRVLHSSSPEDLDPQDRVSFGPAGSSRTYAIVHLAMHDAYFGINPAPHGTYLDGLPPAPPGADTNAAVAAAAHATLSALYPIQKPFFNARHAAAGLSGSGLSEGHAFGLAVASAILTLRENDPGTGDNGYAGSVARGHHRPDPRAGQRGQPFYAPLYGAASRLFAVTNRFQLKDPPARDSQEYLRALREIRSKGIAPELMGTLPAGSDRRTPSETVTGEFWAYDGANLGTPPRHYNQIVRQVAMQQNRGVADNARLFALVNAAMGDAGILAWEEKYRHDLWRPVLGVREHDPSTGLVATGGKTLDPDADPEWYPLGALATNRPGARNLTPPFPAYPSGHATFGAAVFQTVRRHYLKDPDNGRDNLADGLEFVSDELNGISVDNQDTVRTRHVRIFENGLWEMIEDNGRSRVFLGVHWVFDAFAVNDAGEIDLSQNVGGVPLGLNIANNIADRGDNGLKAPAAAFFAGPRLTSAFTGQARTFLPIGG